MGDLARSRPMLCVLLFAVVLPAVGCRGAYYSAMEQIGKHKRHILRDRVDAGREEQKEAEAQFQTAYERFKEAAGYNGGDLEALWERLDGEYEESAEKADAVRTRIASIEEVAADLFEEWQAESEQISNTQLRRSSQDSLEATRERYGQLIAAMKRAESRMDPVLVAFRDQVLFLKHNLNARAIASLEGTVVAIEDDVASLIRDIQASIAESERFIASLES